MSILLNYIILSFWLVNEVSAKTQTKKYKQYLKGSDCGCKTANNTEIKNKQVNKIKL
jgi:hypothetical protein